MRKRYRRCWDVISFVTYIVIFILVMAGAGCSDGETKPEIKDVSNWTGYYRVKFDGHIYIRYSGGYQAGITHDPDCPCYGKNETSTE